VLNRLLIAALVLTPLTWAQESKEIQVLTVSPPPADMAKQIDEALKKAGVDAATRKRILASMKARLPVTYTPTAPKARVVVRRAAPVTVVTKLERKKHPSYGALVRVVPAGVGRSVHHGVAIQMTGPDGKLRSMHGKLPAEIRKRLDALIEAIDAHDRKLARAARLVRKAKPTGDLETRIDRLERKLDRIERLLERLADK